MSILNDPRVSEIDGGYRVINDEAGPITVFPDNNWSDDGWRAYFGSSTASQRHPRSGLAGSRSDDLEKTIEYALRTNEVSP